MKITDYIVNEIKPLTLQQTVKEAQNLCAGLSISHLIIVKDNKLIGCFFEGDIMTIENSEKPLSDFSFLLQHFYTNKEATHLELLKIFADNDANILPVIDQNLNYCGYYELNDVLDVFTNSPFFADESQVLEIENYKKKMYLSEIAQIVEANNAKLLGMYISSETEEKLQITLKVITKDWNELIQTFRRYEYQVITQHKDDAYLEEIKNRTAYLQKYLNM